MHLRRFVLLLALQAIVGAPLWAQPYASRLPGFTALDLDLSLDEDRGSRRRRVAAPSENHWIPPPPEPWKAGDPVPSREVDVPPAVADPARPEPEEESPASEPSGVYTVSPGDGMGHVAQALREALLDDDAIDRVPELWVPPTGGRIGLPHVVACYNNRRLDDWRVLLGQELAFPPHDQIWDMIGEIEDTGRCPEAPRAPRSERRVRRIEPAQNRENFEVGGAFRVVAGHTYSHYGVAARRQLTSLMDEDSVPPLYPAPGAPGILQVMACWNTGDSEDFGLKAGQILEVPPPGAIPGAMEHLRRDPDNCPPGFRPGGTPPGIELSQAPTRD